MAWAILAHVIVGVFFLSPGYIVPDSLGAYSFVRSLVLDHDLLFYNEWAAFSLIEGGVTLFKEVTAIGAVANHWSIGTSILVAPAYLVTHAVAPLLGTADGFTGIYAFTFAWASVMFGALASAIGILLLKRRVSTWIAVVAIVTTWVGMPALWYEYRFPLGTHVAGVLAVAVLLAMLDGEDRNSDRMAVAIGVAFGFAVAVRLQHVMLGPALVWIFLRWQKPLRAHLLAAAGAVLPLLTQLLAWHAIYGHPLGPLVSGASLGGETYMPFRRNALLEVLFSSYHGLFTWSPVALAGVVGLLLYVRRSTIAQVALLMFVAELIANGLFDRYFWGGLSFGPRRFVDLAVPLAIGTAFLIQRFRVAGTITAVAAALWAWLLTGSALSGRLDLAGDVLPRELVLAAFSVPWGEIPAAIIRSAGTFRAPSLSLLSLVIVLVTFSLVIVLAFRKNLRPALTFTYLGFWILLLLIAIPATHRDAVRQMESFGVDPVLSSEIGPLLDGRSLMTHELEFLANRGRDEEAERVAEEIRRTDVRIRELRESRTPTQPRSNPDGGPTTEASPVPQSSPE